MAVVCLCLHCGGETPSQGAGKCGKFCRYCKTVEQRKDMDELNLEQDPKFKCGYCEWVRNKKVEKKITST